MQVAPEDLNPRTQESPKPVMGIELPIAFGSISASWSRPTQRSKRMLEIKQHSDSGYASRTCANAIEADLTAAFAIDFNSPGEALTRKMAGAKYVSIALSMDPLDAARKLFKALRYFNARSLNIAGHGLPTLAAHGWTQESVNAWLFEVMVTVCKHWQLASVRSGGQKGVDIAGLACAYALCIPAFGLLPRGYVQRDRDGTDREHTPLQIREQVQHWASQLIVAGVPAELRQGVPPAAYR